MAWVRRVRTASGATAVQIAESVASRRRIVRHVGSARDEAELGLLIEEANGLLADDQQGVLDLGITPAVPKAIMAMPSTPAGLFASAAATPPSRQSVPRPRGPVVATVTAIAAIHYTPGMPMKPVIFAAVGAAVSVSVLAGCATDTSAKVPTGADLKGTWAQTGAGYEMGSPVAWEDQTLVIEEAEGQGFAGFKEYTRDGEEPQKEIVNGVVGVDGEIAMVDEEGFFEGRLVDEKILGQYVESGEDHGAINVELSRK